MTLSSQHPILKERTEDKFFFYILLLYMFFLYLRPQSFFPFIGFIHPGMILILLLFINIVKNFNFFRLKNIQTVFYLSLLLFMIIHIPMAVNHFEALDTWRILILDLILYLNIILLLNSFKRLFIFINFFLVINVINAVIGIASGGIIVGSSFLGDPNDFALVMNIMLPISYFLFLETKIKKRKTFYLISSIFFVLATVLSFSRGGFVGLIAVVVYSWLKSPRKLLSIVIVVILILIVIFSAPQEYWDRINSITEEGMESGTGAERLFFWKLAVEMFKDHPIIGVGQGNFPYNIRQYQPPDGYYGRSMSGMQAHSIYFTIISELGIIGIIIFIPLFFVSIRDIRAISIIKEKLLQDMVSHYGYSESIAELYKLKYLSMGLLAAYIGYMVCGIFLSVLYYPHLWILLALSVAMKWLEKTITYSIEYSYQNVEPKNND